MPDHLSNSQINLYLNCSLKYKFLYIDRLPKPFKPSGLAFGSVLHSALNWFHKQKMNGNGVTLDRLYRIFDADWYCQKLDHAIQYKESESETSLVSAAKQMLGMYFQSPHNKVKGSEVPFTLPANGNGFGIDFEGWFDLIEENDTIVEFKTSAQTMNQEDADNHPQLTIYSYAYETLFGRPPKTLKIVNFVKNKKPKMIVLKTRRDKTHYQRYFSLAGEVLRGIQNQVFFPRQSFMCKDCEYDSPCRAWGRD